MLSSSIMCVFYFPFRYQLKNNLSSMAIFCRIIFILGYKLLCACFTLLITCSECCYSSIFTILTICYFSLESKYMCIRLIKIDLQIWFRKKCSNSNTGDWRTFIGKKINYLQAEKNCSKSLIMYIVYIWLLYWFDAL